jgi:hypothetical protein
VRENLKFSNRVIELVRRYAPSMLRTLGLLALAAAAAGCGSRPPQAERGPARAVVLSTAAADAQSERIARALNEHGYEVVRKSTTIVREKSAAAVYAVHDHPDRPDEVARILHDELGLTIEVLPFQQHATGGNAVVVWLGREAR